MTIDSAAVDEFAAELREAERCGTPVVLATERFTDLDWDDARRIARSRDELRIADGDTFLGYKLGWTSSAMRTALGIDRPNWGTLWRSQRIHHTLDLRRLRHPKVEPEIVYVADHRLAGTAVTAHDVVERARGWAVGIEVVHPRWPSFDFTWLDNTADNSSPCAIAFCEPTSFDGNIAEVNVQFSDGIEHRTGRGDQAMGSPAEAVAWLVRSLAVEGQGLEAGQIVFTGGLTAPFDVAEGRRYTAQCTPLGVVDFDATTPAQRAPDLCGRDRARIVQDRFHQT